MTGGGVYPALAILQASNVNPSQVLWIGSEGGMEAELISNSGLAFEGIPAAGLHGVGLLSIPGNIVKLLRGWQKARRVIQRFKPDVMLFTGGFIGVPVAFAAAKIPSLVFVPDIEPGLALKVLIYKSSMVAATTELTRHYLPKDKSFIPSGYPLRQDLQHWKRNESRKHLNLDPNLPTILVFGGSKGAQSINHSIAPLLPDILKKFQVIHIWGMSNWEEGKAFQSSLPDDLETNYRAFAFLHENMGATFAASDLVICRAGASTMGELPFFGLPAILIPYPYAWRYQKQNAQYLAEQGAALVLPDEENLSENLEKTLNDLMNSPKIMEKMRAAMQNLNKPNAALDIANSLISLTQKSSLKGETT